MHEPWRTHGHSTIDGFHRVQVGKNENGAWLFQTWKMRHVPSCFERTDCLPGSNGAAAHGGVGRTCVRMKGLVVSRVRMRLLAQYTTDFRRSFGSFSFFAFNTPKWEGLGESCFLVDSPWLLVKLHCFSDLPSLRTWPQWHYFFSPDSFYTKSSDFIIEIHIGSHLHSKEFHFHIVCTYSLVAGLECNQFIVHSESKRTTWSVSYHDIMLN